MKSGLQKCVLVFCLVMAVNTLAAEPELQIPSGLVAIKMVVRDFKTSIEFYVKYFGMKAGPRLNSFEQRLEWAKPGFGSNLTLLHDDSGQLKFPPTTSFLVFRVSDAAVLAKEMRDDGVEDVDEIRDVVMMGVRLRFFTAKDPDRNTVEALQVMGAAAK